MRYQFRGTGMDKIAYSLVIFLRSFWFLLSDYVKHPVLVIINREILSKVLQHRTWNLGTQAFGKTSGDLGF